MNLNFYVDTQENALIARAVLMALWKHRTPTATSFLSSCWERTIHNHSVFKKEWKRIMNIGNIPEKFISVMVRDGKVVNAVCTNRTYGHVPKWSIDELLTRFN